MHKKNKYWQLFLSTFKLSACTFGGGFVIIPLMRERFVKELHWIEEEETLDLTAIAQSSPGSIADSYTHLRAHETKANLVCRLLLEKKKTHIISSLTNLIHT